MGERRYSSSHSLTSTLDGGEWSASHPGCFTSRENPLVPIGWEAGWAPEPLLVRKKAPLIIWTNCVIHTALASGITNVELQSTFQAVICVNCDKSSQLIGRLFSKLCDNMGAEHTAPSPLLP